jgi:radical SAM-linked protein
MPLIQYGPALGVGNVGENELLDFDSPDDLSEAEFLARINAVLPEGLRFKSLARLEAGAQPLARAINQAEYTIALDAPEIRAALERMRARDAALAELADEQIHKKLVEAFMSRDEFLIERNHREKKQKIDARRYTLCAEVSPGRLLRIVTEISTGGSVKPTEVAAAIYGLSEREKLSLSSKVRRLRLLGKGLAGEGLKEQELDFRGSRHEVSSAYSAAP